MNLNGQAYISQCVVNFSEKEKKKFFDIETRITLWLSLHLRVQSSNAGLPGTGRAWTEVSWSIFRATLR
jgi:hypothetical protein